VNGPVVRLRSGPVLDPWRFRSAGRRCDLTEPRGSTLGYELVGYCLTLAASLWAVGSSNLVTRGSWCLGASPPDRVSLATRSLLATV